MQTIIHTDKQFSYVSRLFSDLEYIYAQTSVKKQETNSRRLVERDIPLYTKSIMEMFADAGYYYDFQYSDRSYDKIETNDIPKKNIIVCFSGGKDSLATAIHYKKCGYNVILYHITGLNRSYTKEWKSVDKLADKLKMPLIKEDITYKELNEWVEHPLKNIIMASMALNYGLKNKLAYKIAIGNFYTATLEDNAFDVCAGDCIDLWKVYEKIISKIIPKFHVYIPLKNYAQSYNTILKYDPDLITNIQSCITPNRFRYQFKQRAENKYKINLLDERCGSCWKCAVEYIWMVQAKQFKLDKVYYLHCLQLLRKTIEKETKILYNNIIDVWEHYFFFKMPEWLYEETF